MKFTAEELKIITQALTEASDYCSYFADRYLDAPLAVKAWERRRADYLAFRDRVNSARLELEK